MISPEGVGAFAIVTNARFNVEAHPAHQVEITLYSMDTESLSAGDALIESQEKVIKTVREIGVIQPFLGTP